MKMNGTNCIAHGQTEHQEEVDKQNRSFLCVHQEEIVERMKC